MRNYDFAERDDLIDENIKLKEEIYLLESALATAENKLDDMKEDYERQLTEKTLFWTDAMRNVIRDKDQQIAALKNKD
jgi:hypothetical protein